MLELKESASGRESERDSFRGSDGFEKKVVVHVERTLGMLALTALHDVMKVEALLPR